jgi:PKD repeat protein
MDTLRGFIKPLTLINNVDYDMGKSQQCAVCHQASAYANINGTSGTVKLDSLGPCGTHSGADAQILMGTSGYFLSPAEWTKDSSSHHSTFAVGGCLSCHFAPANATDSSGSGYEFGEHTFRLQRDDGTQYTANCNAAGCHNGLTNFYTVSPHRVDSIAQFGDSLGGRLLALGLLKPGGDSTEYYKDSIVPTDAARILYNYQLYKNDHSRGVHNAKYILRLLKASLVRLDSIPHASFTFTGGDTGCVPFAINFASVVTGSVTDYSWDFGDGNVSTLPNPQHSYQYSDSGKYRPSLTVTGTAGKVTYTSPTLIVVRDTLLKPDFTASVGDPGGADALKVTFTNTSAGAITSYAWDFGDNTGTSQAADTTYTFATAGTYQVKLTITDACKTASKTVAVTVPQGTGMIGKLKP